MRGNPNPSRRSLTPEQVQQTPLPGIKLPKQRAVVLRPRFAA